MTAHDPILELAAVAIDFPLAQGEQDTLDRHLETCPACRAGAAALRADARAIAALPAPRLDLVRADQILGAALVRHAPRPTLRLVGLAALLALLALGALVVGAELLRQTAPPPLVVVPPQPSPSTASSLNPPVPSNPTVAWTTDQPAEAATSLAAGAHAIAESGGRLVAIGESECTTGGDTGTRCWAWIRRSEDGLTWTGVFSGDREVGALFPTSGPQPGMLDIAGGPGGFVAIGYIGAKAIEIAVWTSPDGENWKRSALGTTFAGARVDAVTAAGPGWVIVGRIHAPEGPRGAAWTSRDGRAWTRVPDGPAFDVGGYFNTLEESTSGGLRDVVANGSVVVAVGDVCDAHGGACRAATWRSADAGATWARSSGPDVAGNLGLVVHGEAGFVAFGQACQPDATCGTMVATSTDGMAWTSTPPVLLPAGARVRGAAAIQGGIVAAASTTNSLIVIASRDGSTWQVVHEEGYQPSPGATAPPDYASILGLAAARAANGSAIIVGWVAFQDERTPPMPLLIIVRAGEAAPS